MHLVEYRVHNSCIRREEASMTKAMLIACILLAGCATVAENQCRTGNWYEQGREEALMGNRANAERYAQCSGLQERDHLASLSIRYSEWSQCQPGSRM